MVDKIRVQMGKLLQLPTGSTEEDQQGGQWSRHRRRPAVPAAGSFQGEDSAASGDLEEALNLYLRRTCDKYDISQTYEVITIQRRPSQGQTLRHDEMQQGQRSTGQSSYITLVFRTFAPNCGPPCTIIRASNPARVSSSSSRPACGSPGGSSTRYVCQESWCLWV